MCEHEFICQRYFKLLDNEIRKENSDFIYQKPINVIKTKHICCSLPLWVIKTREGKIYWYGPKQKQLNDISNKKEITVLKDSELETEYLLFC